MQLCKVAINETNHQDTTIHSLSLVMAHLCILYIKISVKFIIIIIVVIQVTY